FVGQQIGKSHWCTDFVKAASGAPAASLWTRGEMVHNNLTIKVGTAIACGWEGAGYPSHESGNHAAIYRGQQGNEIEIYDQSRTLKVEPRVVTHNPLIPYYVIL